MSAPHDTDSLRRIYDPPEFRPLVSVLLCPLIGHRWVDHRGHRVRSDWYCGQHPLYCDRCGRIR